MRAVPLPLAAAAAGFLAWNCKQVGILVVVAGQELALGCTKATKIQCKFTYQMY